MDSWTSSIALAQMASAAVLVAGVVVVYFIAKDLKKK